MAVLGRLKIAPNQRLDLPDIQAFDAYSAGDWQAFLGGMTGGDPFILKGFEIFQPNTLIGNPAGSIDIVLLNSLLWWPNGTEGSFYSSLPAAANRSVTLITDATNYIEMTLVLSSGAQDARALWDPGANGGAGGEFTQVVDTEYFLDVEITRNNTGFSDDKIPLAQVVVNSSNNVVSITDCRELMFRLGSGGNSPNPLNTYAWTDDPVGFSRQDTPTTMTSSLDANTFRGADKNIKDMKSWMNAVMSRIKEIDGGAKWFIGSGGSGSGAGGALSLANLFIDSQAGNSPIPTRQATLAWSVSNDGQFRSNNAPGFNVAIGWKANFGQLKWYLGGSFVSSTNRAYSSFTFNQAVADGENLYLILQRDAIINSNPIVNWQNLSGTSGSASATSTGAFAGVAVGDYIRKDSGTYYQYYQVVELRVNAGTPFANGTVDGTVADATVQYVIVATHDGPITTSSEHYLYFRSKYTTADLYSSNVGIYKTNYYWIGSRSGSMFFLRDYGNMQPGEETEDLDDSTHLGGGNDLILERANDSVYDAAAGYKLKAGGTTNLLTIRRRLEDNTVGTPSNVDNSNAFLTYTIAAPIGLIPDNSGLWVRLGSSSSALIAGSVTNIATDNVYEIRDLSSNPLRDYDNKNVYLLARKYTVGGVSYLIFADGQILNSDGNWINNHLSVQSDLFLKEKHQDSILFIGTTGGRVDENNLEFFWENTGGPDSLGQFGVRNLLIGEDSVNGFDFISQTVPQNVHLLTNLSNFTATIGQSASTIIIPGSLIVQGTTSSISTSNLAVQNKVITVGVGNLLNMDGGSGIAVADDTKSAVSYKSTNAQIYIDITYAAAHGYATGNVVGVDVSDAVGGITAGQVDGSYTVKATGSAAGDAQVISATVLRIFTTATATSTQTITTGTPTPRCRTYLTPSTILLSDSAGTSGGQTSWAFQVKGVATIPTITPVLNYGVVPTTQTANFVATRIPFADSANTLNFSAGLAWNDSTKILSLGQAGKLFNISAAAISATYNVVLPATQGAANTSLINDGAGNLSWTSAGAIGSAIAGGTPGSVLFIDSSSALAQDNAQFFWDDTNHRLAVGTNTPLTGAGFTVNRDNTDYTNTGGVDAHIVLSNPNAAGMTSIISVTNGTVVGKWRTDFAGNVNYSSFAGGHDFFTGGDSGVGTSRMVIANNGNVSIGTTFTTSLVNIGTNTAVAAGGITFGNDTTLYRSGITTLRTSGTLEVGTALKLLGSTSGSVSVAATTTTTPYSLIMPAAQGAANSVPYNDGSGNLSWHSTANAGVVAPPSNTFAGAPYTPFISGGAQRAFQVVLTSSTTFTSMQVKMYQDGTVTSGIQLQVQPDNSGVPADYPITSLFTSATTPATSVPTGSSNAGLVNFNFAGQVLPAGTYWIIVDYVNTSDGGTTNLVCGGSGATYFRGGPTNLWTGPGGPSAYFILNPSVAGTGDAIIRAAAGGLLDNSWVAYAIQFPQVGIGTAASSYLLQVGGNTTAATGGAIFGTGLSNIYRPAADTLKTDGSFIVAGNLTAGNITATGALNLNYGTVRTANYTATITDNVIPVNTNGGSFTVTLPPSTTANKGQLIVIKDVAGFVVNTGKALFLAPNGTDTIDTSNATIKVDFSSFASLSLVSSGAGGWILI